MSAPVGDFRGLIKSADLYLGSADAPGENESWVVHFQDGESVKYNVVALDDIGGEVVVYCADWFALDADALRDKISEEHVAVTDEDLAEIAAADGEDMLILRCVHNYDLVASIAPSSDVWEVFK